MFVQAIDDRGRVRYAVTVARAEGPTGPGTPAPGEAFGPDEPVPAEGEGPPVETNPAREDDDGTTEPAPAPARTPPPTGAQGGGRRP
jgi:hypothetical protein